MRILSQVNIFNKFVLSSQYRVDSKKKLNETGNTFVFQDTKLYPFRSSCKIKVNTMRKEDVGRKSGKNNNEGRKKQRKSGTESQTISISTYTVITSEQRTYILIVLTRAHLF